KTRRKSTYEPFVASATNARKPDVPMTMPPSEEVFAAVMATDWMFPSRVNCGCEFPPMAHLLTAERCCRRTPAHELLRRIAPTTPCRKLDTDRPARSRALRHPSCPT